MSIETSPESLRWGPETIRCAKALGWTVVETVGEADYQGWGVHLLHKPTTFTPEALMVINDATEEEAAGWQDRVNRIKSDPINVVAVEEWAVMHWGYGSFSGCDSYESEWQEYDRETYKPRPDAELDALAVEMWGELIETRPDEVSARMLFDERKGW